MVVPLPDRQLGPGLVGKIVGRCFVAELLGGGQLGAVYHVQHRNIQQRVVLIAFFLPGAWSVERKYCFIVQALTSVARQLPGNPALAPVDEPGIFEHVAYWATLDRPGLVSLLLSFLQQKIVLSVPNSELAPQKASQLLAERPRTLTSENGSWQEADRESVWQWALACFIELLTLGGASFAGIAVSEALTPLLHLTLLVVVVRVAVGGLLSLTGLRLAKYLRRSLPES